MTTLAYAARRHVHAQATVGASRRWLLLVMALVACADLSANALTPYPLTICIITGDTLNEDPIVFSYDGREIKTCCTDCIDQFYKDPAGFVAKIEEAAARAEKK